MDIVMKASTDASTYGDISSSHIGLTSSVLPEAKMPNLGKRSQTGVSTRNVPLRTSNQKNIPHWFALRTTYGREKKAYEYIISRNGTAFYPTIIIYTSNRVEICYINCIITITISVMDIRQFEIVLKVYFNGFAIL